MARPRLKRGFASAAARSGGGVVFIGAAMDRYLRAFDAKALLAVSAIGLLGAAIWRARRRR